MKKVNVVQKNKDFNRIIVNNKPYKSKNFIIYVEKTQNEIYHFGISVSKKICNAVGRNRIKRRIKSIIDKNNYQNNFNCIIIVKKGILNHTYQEIEKDLTDCFLHLKIIKGETL